MAKYLLQVKKELDLFEQHQVAHIPRENNTYADALARLATSRDTELLKMAPVEVLPVLSIDREAEAMQIDPEPSWIDEYREYLVNDV